jgi:hypothetical protein
MDAGPHERRARRSPARDGSQVLAQARVNMSLRIVPSMRESSPLSKSVDSPDPSIDRDVAR